MKKKVLVPYVEIPSPRKRKLEVFSPDSSPETEPTSPNLSPVKRSRLDTGSTVDRLASLVCNTFLSLLSPSHSQYTRQTNASLCAKSPQNPTGRLVDFRQRKGLALLTGNKQTSSRGLSPTVSDLGVSLQLSFTSWTV